MPRDGDRRRTGHREARAVKGAKRRRGPLTARCSSLQPGRRGRRVGWTRRSTGDLGLGVGHGPRNTVPFCPCDMSLRG